MAVKKIDMAEVVGLNYGDFWRFKGRYRVVKGSRSSKKSVTTTLNIIYRMMQYPEANVLVVRRYYNTHRDSTFAELIKAIKRLQVEKYWSWKQNPLEITYLPTGQKILFRG